MFAERMSRLGTETAFEVLARAKAMEAEGRDMVHLEIGEPDFDTPPNIVKAAIMALKSGFTHYGPLGIGDKGFDSGPEFAHVNRFCHVNITTGGQGLFGISF